MADRLVSVDDNFNFPSPVTQRLAARLGDSSTVEGKALDAKVKAGLDARPAPSAVSVGRKVLFLGDSHTEGVGASDPRYAFVKKAIHLAGTYNFSLTNYVNAGIGGQTSSQMLARIDPLLTSDVGLLVLGAGANDAKVANNLPQYASNMLEMIARARAKGIPVVLFGVPPKEATVVENTETYLPNIDRYNTWLRFTAQEKGIPFADIYPALVDTSNWMLRAEFADTPTRHMNDAGHNLVAQLVSAAMLAAIPHRTEPENGQRRINLVANGFMAGEAQAPNGLPPGWTVEAGTAAYTVESDSFGVLPGGRWIKRDFASTATTDQRIRHNLDTSRMNAGDTFAMSAVILVEDHDGSWEANCVAGTANAYFNVQLPSGASLTPSFDRASGRKIAPGLYAMTKTWYIGKAPAVPEGLLMRFSYKAPAGTHYTLRFGAASVINLTTNGITQYS